jgi:hypothetical protein
VRRLKRLASTANPKTYVAIAIATQAIIATDSNENSESALMPLSYYGRKKEARSGAHTSIFRKPASESAPIEMLA